MGHDIYAYKSKQAELNDEEEVAYLRRGAFNELHDVIYDVLECHRYNAGVSGNGDGQYFTQKEIIKAIKKLTICEDHEPERNFLCDCLKHINPDAEIYIEFR